MKITDLIVIGGLHGDEPTGINICKKLEGHSKGIKTIIAHNEAIKKNIRFLETDLNRSFNTEVPTSLEEKLAEEMKITLKKSKYNFLIDIHNTKAPDVNCAIVVNYPNIKQQLLATYFGFDKIVIMPPSGSLISLNPTKSISLEISENSLHLFEEDILIKKFRELIGSDINKTKKELSIYKFSAYVQRSTLKRLKIDEEKIQNFKEIGKINKKKMGFDQNKQYYPLFARNDYPKTLAFILIEKIR